MKRLPIALQLYSIRGDMERDFEHTLEIVRYMGYEGVEFAGLFGREPASVRAICKTLGLNPISSHVPINMFIENAEQTLLDCKALGCEFVVIPWLEREYLPGNRKYNELITLIQSVGKRARELGMTLLYHNHDFDFKQLDGAYLLDIMYNDIAQEYLETQIDACWVNVAGENPAAYLRSYTGRAPVVHLKDYNGGKSDNMYALIGIDEDNQQTSSGSFEFRPLGKGVQDIRSLLSAASDCGAQWLVVEQDEPTAGISAIDCAKSSIEYLKSLYEQ